MKFFIHYFIICLYLSVLSACSFNSFTSHISSLFIESSIASLNTEKDLIKAKQQLSENITLLEKMLNIDKNNKNLHIYTAQAYYSYAFAFIEDNNKHDALALYYQSYLHATAALATHNISREQLKGKSPQLKNIIHSLNKEASDALFWTAVSWAKIIEINQPNILLLAQLHKTAILMKQVTKLDRSYHLGGPDLFFAVYYGSRPGILGGNDYLSKKHFNRARKFNKNRLLIVDYLQAKYLNGRTYGEKKLNQNLHRIINTPDNLYPEQALMNAVAKQKAFNLLKNNKSYKLNTSI